MTYFYFYINMNNSITLEDRILCDLEMILLGGFAPLNGFLNENDYNSVVENCQLCDGSVWPLPIVLPVREKEHDKLQNESVITLKDKTGLPIAQLVVESRWKPDLVRECEMAYGSSDTNHPYVDIVLGLKDCWYYGGRVEKIMDVKHYDFMEYRMSAEKCREMIAGFPKTSSGESVPCVGFQTRNPMHRSHFELTKYALKKCEGSGAEAKLILMPVVGITQSCDVDYQVRTRCYKKLMPYYEGKAELVLIPLSMRMAGPREAVLHAIIRKNYGCTHFIVGRDHAGPSYKKKDGTDFYGPYDAHALVEKYKGDIGIEIVLSQMIVYVENLEKYLPMNEVRVGGVGGDKVLNISGTEQRRLLKTGAEIPAWFSFPEIVEELRLEYRMLNKRGLCIYLTGLSGSGKSTVANFLMEKIMENEKERKITLLDADVVRTNLSKGLGFSREDRSTNVRRIGYVCSEIVKHGGIVVVANIAPYEDDRKYNRESIEGAGGTYVECFVDTTLEKCEERDVKGLYALARKGVIKEFTGISDPYERPLNPEITIDGAMSLDVIIEKIVDWLNKRELL